VNHVDAFGKHLVVGDEAIYTYLYSSRYLHIAHVVVVGSTAKQVKIEFKEIRHNGEPVPQVNPFYPVPGEVKGVPPHLLVKVEKL
jgi:hypothetical protein